MVAMIWSGTEELFVGGGLNGRFCVWHNVSAVRIGSLL